MPPKVKPFVERRQRRWCFVDLFTDSRTGRMQESKTFSVLGKTAALFWLCDKSYNGEDTIEFWVLVMCVLTAHAMFTTIVSAKFGNAQTGATK